MNTVKIKSTRMAIVTFPEVNKGAEAKAKGLKYFPMQAIRPKAITPLDPEYWDAIKDNEMVKTLLDGGGLSVVTDAEGSALPDSLIELQDVAAMVYVSNCDDVQQIIKWMRDARGQVLQGLQEKLKILESAGAEMGSSRSSKGKQKDQPSAA